MLQPSCRVASSIICYPGACDIATFILYAFNKQQYNTVTERLSSSCSRTGFGGQTTPMGEQLTPDQAPPPGTTSSRVTHPGGDLLGEGGISSVTERLVATFQVHSRVLSTVAHYPVSDCKREHNAGLILVATSCLLHLTTQFLCIVL